MSARFPKNRRTATFASLALLAAMGVSASGARASSSDTTGTEGTSAAPASTADETPSTDTAAAGGSSSTTASHRGSPSGKAPAVADTIEDSKSATSQTTKASTSDATSGASAAQNNTSNLTPIALPTGVDKSGVTGKTLSIPKGEGTIEGMGESFSAQLSTGIATYSVPIAVPKARGGVSVNLGLSYSSSSGYGLAGVGWDIGVPFIARQTDRGLPNYDDRTDWHPGQDRFAFNGGQELVPVCTVSKASGSSAGGTCTGALVGESFPDYVQGWQYFRPRVEGSFQRFFWSADHQTWIVQDKSGVTLELGVPLDGSGYKSALEVNPDPSTAGKQEIFRWHIVRQYDAHFTNISAPLNSVVYRYTPNGNQAYISDIFDTPAASGATANLGTYAHHVHVNYENRTDPTLSYRSGWRIDQNWRISGIDVASKSFNGGANDPRYLVRRYHLSYDSSFHASLLSSVQVEGRCESDEQSAPTEDGNGLFSNAKNCDRLPAMTFDYSHVDPFTSDGKAGSRDLPGYEGFDERVQNVSNSPAHSVDEAYTDLFDINSDGLPDVLVTAAGLYGSGHGVFFNTGASYGSVTQMGINGVLGADASTITLHNPNVTSLDFDGDGRVNLVHVPIAKTYAVYDAIQKSGGWFWQGNPVAVATNQNVKIDFGRDTTNVQVADVNFDGLVDVVVSTGTEYQTFLSLGRYPGGFGQFGYASWTSAVTSSISNDPIRTCVPYAGLPVQLSDKETKLADMNGDGIVDIVKLQRGQVQYWPGRGNGFWGTGHRDDCGAGTFGSNRSVMMTSSPQWSDLSGDSLRLDDVNGDGLPDIVQVRFDGVDVWLNVDGASFTNRHIISNTPASPSYAQRVRLTDINGSGTPDILWAEASNYKYIDLTGGKRPHLLVGVSNGLGKRTSLEYSTSAAEMLAAEAKGACDPSSPPADIWSKGWCSKMPTVTSVVKRVTETDQIVAAGEGPSTLVTQYDYRDPVYEGRQREFRGFRFAKATRVGDNNSPTDVTESSFLLGECTDDGSVPGTNICDISERWRDNPNEALKGLPWLTQKRSANGVYLSTEFTKYRLRKLYSGLDGRAIKHAVALSKTDYLYDTSAAQSAAAPLSPTVVESTQITASGQSNTESSPKSTSASFIPRASPVTTFSESEVDVFGNQTTAIAHGCISGCDSQVVDEALTSITTPKALTDDVTRWMWRTTESYTSGSAHGDALFKHQYTAYNQFGDATKVTAALAGSLMLDRHHATAGKAVASAPSGASTDRTITIATTTYDAYGNPTRVEGANGRCGDVSYDLAYAQFPASETVYTQGCGQGALVLRASAYDRGFAKVTIAIDMQGQPTKVDYDAFGRTIGLHKPNPDGISFSTNPSISIEYFLPPSLGNNISAIHTKTEDGANIGDGQYLESWSFIDGFGRTRTQLSEADPAADGANWVVSGLVTYDAKGAVQRKYVEDYFVGAATDFSIASAPTTLYGSQRYDAFGRALQTFDLDGTVTLQAVYHAQSKDLYDAADLEVGEHQNTFATEVTDGHGRVIRATERTKVKGQIEQHHIKTTYSPLGAPEVIRRQRADGSASPDVVRWMRYDSLGRLVFNADPHTTNGYLAPPGASTTPSAFATTANGTTAGGSNPGSYAVHAWRYVYNDAGDLVATSDARGCGSNFEYDGAGRLLGEDYSPCEATHADYSAPSGTPSLGSNHGASGGNPAFSNGWEVVYQYDGVPTGDYAPASIPTTGYLSSWWHGRLAAVADRGALSVTQYDGRGRVTKTARRVAKPAVPGQTPNDLGQRYAPRWYFNATAYDAADRPTNTSAGLRSTELKAASVTNSPIPRGTNDPDFTASTLVTGYTARGTLRGVSGSYGTLIAGIKRRADGLVENVTYGDLAKTQTFTGYDGRRRPTSIQTVRSAPGVWTTLTSGYTPAPAGAQTTLQLILQDLDITYDIVGNPTEIRDWRDPAEWPIGAKPVTRKIAYDDLYRVNQIQYEYSANDASWISPFARENGEHISDASFDHRRNMPSPYVSFQKRVLEQDISYDWLGNTSTTDDDAHGFYDRSLGTITNNSVNGKPYQLTSATNASKGGNRTGSLNAKYDVAGNLTDMAVNRNPINDAACLPSGSGCNQTFHYQWDEVGRLVHAQRWDIATTAANLGIIIPTTTPPADLTYTYDASDNRVLKSATAKESNVDTQRHSVYISGGQELRGAKFAPDYLDSGATGADYQIDSKTEVAYLFAHGVRLGRVAHDNGTGMPSYTANAFLPAQHVLINLDDTLGSTSIVIDRATSELVEASSYLAHGATESDYRPDRWNGLREDYRFTGKEEDVEVGLQYFGKRFLSPYIGRWVSADPSAVQNPGSTDPNLYAYVSGQVLRSVDPVGLQGTSEESQGSDSFSTDEQQAWKEVESAADATWNEKRADGRLESEAAGGAGLGTYDVNDNGTGPFDQKQAKAANSESRKDPTDFFRQFHISHGLQMAAANFGELQLGARQNFEQFLVAEKAIEYEKYPGMELSPLGSWGKSRDLSHEIQKKPGNQCAPMHALGLANDFTILDNGKLIGYQNLSQPQYQKFMSDVGVVAKESGVDWGGSWRNTDKEGNLLHMEHFQVDNGNGCFKNAVDLAYGQKLDPILKTPSTWSSTHPAGPLMSTMH